ncbi:ESX secretion-associated protein EspG [Mycobacterium sp. SMC-17]|uniref:ESX secretion-associated protein EspG n=1 Tax=Mycobacterium sp. SMC-17 TaxID=3381628 RepID=UPI003875EA60
MLTTTVNQLWVLQALCGAETMPVGLGHLKPYIPSVHSDMMVDTTAGSVPLTATAEYDCLRRTTPPVIDANGRVDDVVRDWMTVLSRPDREVILAIRIPNEPATETYGPTVSERTMVICRHQNRYLAMAARSGDEIVIGGVGESQSLDGQTALMTRMLLPAFGYCPPADIDGINVPKAALMQAIQASAGAGAAGITAALKSVGLSPWDAQVVTAATQLDDSAMAVVTILDRGAQLRAHERVLTVADTEYGRVTFVTKPGADGTEWMSIWPTTEASLEQDLAEFLAVGQLV